MAGKLVHFEIPAQDDNRATKFYGDLFGWQWNTQEMPGLAYHMTQAGEVGGGLYADDERAGSGPLVYFDAEDIDATVARVRELGGEAEDKQPIPGVGWFARCQDTEGNAFSLFQGDESVAPPS